MYIAAFCHFCLHFGFLIIENFLSFFLQILIIVNIIFNLYRLSPEKATVQAFDVLDELLKVSDSIVWHFLNQPVILLLLLF